MSLIRFVLAAQCMFGGRAYFCVHERPGQPGLSQANVHEAKSQAVMHVQARPFPGKIGSPTNELAGKSDRGVCPSFL